MVKYTADFETTTDLEDCRVWAYAICEIGQPENFIYGNNIEDFMKWCENSDNAELYFNNLKFDGEFIFYYLLSSGYECVKNKKDKKSKSFTCLISDMGQFYSIEVYFEINGHHTKKVTFYDSLKILNMSVDKIAKGFNLPIRKLEIDYHEKREIGHILTKQEIDYIRNDVEIMSRALHIMFNENLTKMTIGSNAINFFKENFEGFNDFFPKLDYQLYHDIKDSYKGGFTYLNPIYKEKIIGEGIVLDVNSLYPSVMKNEKLPYGYGVFFPDKYEPNSLYDLYIQCITCSFELKEGKIPTIQLKNSLHFMPNEYVTSSGGDIVCLTLTNIDLELFLEHYNVYDLEYHGGFMYQSMRGIFDFYIDYWFQKKDNAKKEHNDAVYLISKLMLNALYGKFGSSMDISNKYPYLNDEGVVKYHLEESEKSEGIYLPMACFITSYARHKTITSSQKIKDFTKSKYGIDMYIYSDTDSIHTTLTNVEELKNIIDIDEYRLGAWKVESKFRKAKFLRQKCYIEDIWNEDDGIWELKTTVAGLPKNLGNKINFHNFNKNFTTEGKLAFKHVKGGIVLVDTSFSIK